MLYLIWFYFGHSCEWCLGMRNILVQSNLILIPCLISHCRGLSSWGFLLAVVSICHCFWMSFCVFIISSNLLWYYVLFITMAEHSSLQASPSYLCWIAISVFHWGILLVPRSTNNLMTNANKFLTLL